MTMLNKSLLPQMFNRLAGLIAALMLAACGGGGGGGADAPIVATPDNIVPITINGGLPGLATVNLPYVSVTICAPGTSNCKTIDNIILDTGSTGLRILASALSNGPQLLYQVDNSGNPVAECALFADGYTWGAVRGADVKLGGKTAPLIPIQVIADSAVAAQIPAGCSGFGSSVGTLAGLGGNGILGLGLFLEDCGAFCLTPNNNIYYACTQTSCTSISQPLVDQLPNPVAQFDGDNNGFIISLPPINSTGAVQVNGSLVLGISTRANNQLGDTKVYETTADTGVFTTVSNGTAYPNSFLDSGSNVLLFPDNTSTIPVCSINPPFYCPTNLLTLSATNIGRNGASGVVTFNVGNADQLLSSNNNVFNNLAISAQALNNPQLSGFDFGLPFFLGRNVFVGIEKRTSSSTTAPYWAF